MNLSNIVDCGGISMSRRLYGKLNLSEIYQISLFIMCTNYLISQIYCFSNNETFDFINSFLSLISYILLIFIIYNNFRNLKIRWVKYIVFVSIIALIGIENAQSTGVMKYFLLTIAASNINYSKIVNALLYSFTSVTVFSFFLYLFGFSAPYRMGKNAISLGFVHPNVTSLVIITICFLWLSKKNTVKSKELFALLFAFLEIFFLQKSKVASIVLIVLPILFLVVKKCCLEKYRICKYFAEFIQLFVFFITVILIVVYPLTIYDRFRNVIDSIFTYRPYLNFNNVMQYGVTLWGRNIDIFNTTDYAYNYYLGYVSNNKYNTVDCAYVIGLINIGIIPMAIMFICYIKMINKAWQNCNYMVITISILFAIYGFIENGTNEWFYFFTYFYLLANDDISYKTIYKRGKINDT